MPVIEASVPTSVTPCRSVICTLPDAGVCSIELTSFLQAGRLAFIDASACLQGKLRSLILQTAIDALLQFVLLLTNQKDGKDSQHQQLEQHQAGNQLTADCSRPK